MPRAAASVAAAALAGEAALVAAVASAAVGGKAREAVVVVGMGTGVGLLVGVEAGALEGEGAALVGEAAGDR